MDLNIRSTIGSDVFFSNNFGALIRPYSHTPTKPVKIFLFKLLKITSYLNQFLYIYFYISVLSKICNKHKKVSKCDFFKRRFFFSQEI
jgi:hypothetical protein